MATDTLTRAIPGSHDQRETYDLIGGRNKRLSLQR